MDTQEQENGRVTNLNYNAGPTLSQASRKLIAYLQQQKLLLKHIYIALHSPEQIIVALQACLALEYIPVCLDAELAENPVALAKLQLNLPTELILNTKLIAQILKSHAPYKEPKQLLWNAKTVCFIESGSHLVTHEINLKEFLNSWQALTSSLGLESQTHTFCFYHHLTPQGFSLNCLLPALGLTKNRVLSSAKLASNPKLWLEQFSQQQNPGFAVITPELLLRTIHAVGHDAMIQKLDLRHLIKVYVGYSYNIINLCQEFVSALRPAQLHSQSVVATLVTPNTPLPLHNLAPDFSYPAQVATLKLISGKGELTHEKTAPTIPTITKVNTGYTLKLCWPQSGQTPRDNIVGRLKITHSALKSSNAEPYTYAGFENSGKLYITGFSAYLEEHLEQTLDIGQLLSLIYSNLTLLNAQNCTVICHDLECLLIVHSAIKTKAYSKKSHLENLLYPLKLPGTVYLAHCPLPSSGPINRHQLYDLITSGKLFLQDKTKLQLQETTLRANKTGTHLPQTELEPFVQQWLAKHGKINILNTTQHFSSYGLSYFDLSFLAQAIYQRFNIWVNPITLWSFPNIKGMLKLAFNEVFLADSPSLPLPKGNLSSKLNRHQAIFARELKSDYYEFIYFEPLSHKQLLDRIKALLQAHHSLSHHFLPTSSKNPSSRHYLEYFDLSQLSSYEQQIFADSALNTLQSLEFNDQSPSLWRIYCIKWAPNSFTLALNTSQALMDNISAQSLICLLVSDTITPPRFQYADFVAWQETNIQQNQWQSELNYWCNKLSTKEPYQNIERPNKQDDSSSRKNLTSYQVREWSQANQQIMASQWTKVSQTAKKMGCSKVVLLLSAWQILLYQTLEQTELRVITNTPNRTAQGSLELIGVLENYIVLQNTIYPKQMTQDFISSVSDLLVRALHNSNIPFAKLQEHMIIPSCQSGFCYWQHLSLPERDTKSLQLSSWQPGFIPSSLLPTKLNLLAQETEDALLLCCYGSKELYSTEQLQNILKQFVAILTTLVSNSNLPVSFFSAKD